jgi:hypothetical protein
VDVADVAVALLMEDERVLDQHIEGLLSLRRENFEIIHAH